MAIVWPETTTLSRKGNTIRIEDNAARWSAKVGDRIRLGGKASDDISAINLDNKAVFGCVGALFRREQRHPTVTKWRRRCIKPQFMLSSHLKYGSGDQRMTGTTDADEASMQQLLDTPDLAEALGSDRFKQFLDNIPIAIAVSELEPSEHIIYVNMEFERLSGLAASDVQGKPWSFLPGQAAASDDDRELSDAIAQEQDYIGTFLIEHDVANVIVDAWSNIIDDEDGNPVFRLIAMADANRRGDINLAEFEQRIRDKDILLNELQHRVKNNLQMITALIRMESRRIPDDAHANRFDRLAGRVEALSLLYRSLSDEGSGEVIDLGIYLSQIASAVMRAHAVEGIRLDMQVDTWPVSINVAMPTGLVVNELLTNALKHAFEGCDGGTITLHSLVDETGCRVMVGDDGIGLAKDATWPKPGKLGAMIVQSLRQNAKADIEVQSEPGKGVQVTIIFDRADV